MVGVQDALRLSFEALRLRNFVFPLANYGVAVCERLDKPVGGFGHEDL